MRSNKGFTIIELLIVIVIIGILVAITAVSYTGITNGANTADAQTKARAISQYAVACHAKTGSYPITSGSTLAACDTGMTLPTGITIGTPASGTQKTVFSYNDTTGAVGYWDSAKSSPGVVLLNP